MPRSHVVRPTAVVLLCLGTSGIARAEERSPARIEAPRDASTPEAKQRPDYDGVYVRLDLVGQFGASASSGLAAQPCRAAACDSQGPYGGMLALHVGYSFGWLGVEAIGFGSYDASVGSTGTAEEGDDWQFHRAGGGAALGLRATLKHSLLRPTIGVAGGFARRAMLFARAARSSKLGAQDVYVSDPAWYTAPALLIDGGILIGSTPGAKLALGFVASAEHAGRVEAPAGGGMEVGLEKKGTAKAGAMAEGVQVFVGPMLGGQFGH